MSVKSLRLTEERRKSASASDMEETAGSLELGIPDDRKIFTCEVDYDREDF
jgi:hypothetical protein